jgi:hypothetical protein
MFGLSWTHTTTREDLSSFFSFLHHPTVLLSPIPSALRLIAPRLARTPNRRSESVFAPPSSSIYVRNARCLRVRPIKKPHALRSVLAMSVARSPRTSLRARPIKKPHALRCVLAMSIARSSRTRAALPPPSPKVSVRLACGLRRSSSRWSLTSRITLYQDWGSSTLINWCTARTRTPTSRAR